MKTNSNRPYLILLASFLLGGCAAEGSTTGTAESELNTGSETSSQSLGAKDGPFSASIVDQRLLITYSEPLSSSFLLCDLFPRQPDLTLVFVVGETSLTRKMTVSCPRSWGDNLGSTNRAVFVVDGADDPALWDTLFPPTADGSRWYALRVAAKNSWGHWDSRFGADYRLVFTGRAW